jgi:Fur family ferric uptake transcriptional regulator
MGTKTSIKKAVPAGFEEKLEILRQHLTANGLRHTQQREVVLAEFLRRHQHFTIEDLWKKVRKVDPSIGYATVYRTLRLFTECGIASKHDFGEGSARFETESDQHHDHMICTKCGSIIEFENKAIEDLQKKVCNQYHFKLASHRMELYGICTNCHK